MNKKWLLILTGIFLSIMMAVGCNVDPDPAEISGEELEEDIEEPFEDPDGNRVDENVQTQKTNTNKS
ncbi:hypothetical protein [Bacillus sp. V2I10]|uniref:hypothetical protein n=1 Tax=Bacillus sp. V2I10 TaxID=3042276 RepID=UPI00277DEE44|nr:hypothetical protein [Bacillus sp. V2I10]MDQ0860899.1 hypothetical protein [Bacillus sp. V2I10]